MNENLKFKGELHVVLRDQDGVVKQEFTCPNLVVTAGLVFIASRMASGSATVMSHMAIGSSATAPTSGDTTLNTELGRVALTSATASTDHVTYVATFPAGTGTGTVNEAGLFNAGVAGTMLAHSLFAATITKGAGDSLDVTWTVTAA